MELLKAILGRRSIRRYEKREVEPEKINEILKAATWAPSAGNMQSWRFYVMGAGGKRTAMWRACRNQSSVRDASHLVVVCFDRKATRSYGKRGEEVYALQETAAATQNMMLRAHELGLGTCWIGAFEEAEVSKLLELPRDVKPVAVVTVGYPAESPRSQRRDFREVTTFPEEWRECMSADHSPR
jgi:nitroreductase